MELGDIKLERLKHDIVKVGKLDDFNWNGIFNLIISWEKGERRGGEYENEYANIF